MTDLFISVDWGTSRFRLRAIRASDTAMLAEHQSDAGVASLAADGEPASRLRRFETTLLSGLQALSAQLPEAIGSATVVISGMASSSLGWQELPYAHLPLQLDGTGLVWRTLELSDSGPRVLLISGVQSDVDIMRGEETESLGVFQLPAARNLRDDALLILPGTHSKHIRIAEGQLVSFQTFMTGELFELLGQHSILRHSVGAGSPPPEQAADTSAAFRDGVRQAADAPLSAALFQVRTRSILSGHGPAENRAFLSGLLIGSELATLLADDRADRPVILAGAGAVRSSYFDALSTLGLSQQTFAIPPSDVDRLSALGQRVLLQHLAEL